MKILITGCCGFIGFNFANFLAKTNKKILVIGIDNFSDYYSVNYKKRGQLAKRGSQIQRFDSRVPQFRLFKLILFR